MSRKFQDIQQSYWEAKFATTQISLGEPHYTDKNFKFCEIFIIKFSEKILKNPKKTSYLLNNMNLISDIQRQDLQLLRVLLKYPTTTLGSSNFEKLHLKISNLENN